MIVKTNPRSALETRRIDCCHSVAVPTVFRIIVVVDWDCYIADHRDIFVIQISRQPDSTTVGDVVLSLFLQQPVRSNIEDATLHIALGLR